MLTWTAPEHVHNGNVVSKGTAATAVTSWPLQPRCRCLQMAQDFHRSALPDLAYLCCHHPSLPNFVSCTNYTPCLPRTCQMPATHPALTLPVPPSPKFHIHRDPFVRREDKQGRQFTTDLSFCSVLSHLYRLLPSLYNVKRTARKGCRPQGPPR